MRRPLTSLSTRTEEVARCELPLREPSPVPNPVATAVPPERRPADRIKAALLRWLEEEL